MTCIVGLLDSGQVYLGADSAGVSGLDLTIRADQKLFRNGPFLMGFTSSFRMGQLLRYSLRPPLPQPEEEVHGFMVTTFVNAVRDCLKTGGWSRRVNEEEAAGTFLVGFAGRLFAVYDDYQVGESAHPFAAVGSGAAYALGALYATPRLPPRERVLLALETAERFNAGVRGPFCVACLENGQA